MAKTLPKINNTDTNVKQPSNGGATSIDALMIALGTILTGIGNINSVEKMVAEGRSKGIAKTGNKGLLSILTRTNDILDVITGGHKKNIFKEYIEISKSNQQFLKDNVLKTDIINGLKKIPNLLDTVNSSIETVIDTIKDVSNKNSSGTSDNNENVNIKGGGDLADLLNSVKNFTYSKESRNGLEQLAADTTKGGIIHNLFTNIDTLNSMNVDVDKFKNTLDRINNVNNTSVEAVGDSKNRSRVISAVENVASLGLFIVGVIGIGLLLVVVGLLSKWIDFGGIALFGGILLGFILTLTGIFILASKYIKNPEVLNGLSGITDLVIASGLLLLFGGLIMKWINVSDLLLFTATLALFIALTLAPFVAFSKIVQQIDMTNNLTTIIRVVVISAAVMIFGSLAMKLINLGDLLLFTLSLGLFIFGILGVLHLAHKLYQGDGHKGMRDALLLIVGSAFIMFLGAAVIPALSIINLIKFTFTLGMFLLVTLGVLALVGIWWKWGGGDKDMKSALFLIVGSAFIMFLGAAVMEHLNFWSLGLFVLTLFGFLAGTLSIFNFLAPDVAMAFGTAQGIALIIGVSAGILLLGGMLFLNFPGLLWAVPVFELYLIAFVGSILFMYKQWGVGLRRALSTAKGISLIVGVSGAMLLVGGMLFVYYPDLLWAVPVWGAYLGIFVLAMVGIIKLLSMIDTKSLGQATLALLGISGVMAIMTGVFFALTIVTKEIKKVGWGHFLSTLGLVTVVVGIMCLAVWGLAAIAPAAEFAYVGIGVILALSAAFAIVSVSLLAIAAVIEKLSKLKEFNVEPIVKSIGGLYKLANALTPLALYAYPLMIVSGVVMMMSCVISSVAENVKEYADLKIKIYEGTKHVGYRHLERSDFKNASENVSLLVNTLSEGLMRAYNDHKEWYGGDVSGLWALAGPRGLIGAAIAGSQKSPLEKVIAQSKLLGPLISKIAEAVKDYADLKIKIYDGTKHVGYRHLEKSDFQNAAKNIALVVETLTLGIMGAYEAHPEWYGFSMDKTDFFDWAFNSGTPLERVIKQSKMLAALISKIGNAVGNMGDLKIATEWDKNGDPKAYRHLDRSDFKNAATNVDLVVTTMTQALMDVYENHTEWYEDGWIDDSPLVNVIKTNEKLGKLISKIASSVKDYADLKIATAWDKEGKATAFRSMDTTDFVMAAMNIGLLVTTTAMGLMGYNPDGTPNDSHNIIETYMLSESHWYEDNNTDKFNRLLDSSIKIGSIITSLAEGISHFSDMMFPDQWDPKTGKPIHFKQLDDKDFRNAANCITTVITTVAEALINIIEEDKKLPEEKRMWNIDDDFEESPLYVILSASEKMGNVISNMAKGISSYAQMKFVSEYDSKGNPKKFETLNNTDLTQATKNITDTITLVAATLIGIYESNPEMWEVDDGFLGMGSDDMSPIERVIDGSMKMADIIKNTAEGIMMFAGGNMGSKDNPIVINDDTIKLAKTSITQVLTTTAVTLNSLMTNSNTKQLFINDNTTLMVESIMNMTNVISGTAAVVQSIASLSIPEQFDKDGKPTKFRPMNEQDFTDASTNINKILTAIGGALNEVINNANNSWLKDIDDSAFAGIGNFFNKVRGKNTTRSSSQIVMIMMSMMAMASTLSLISGCIYGYAKMVFPKGVDDNGKILYSEELSYQDLDKAKDNIVKVVTVLGNAMVEASMHDTLSRLFTGGDDNSGLKKMTDHIEAIVDTITDIAKSVDDLTNNESVKSLDNIISKLKKIIPSVKKLSWKLSSLLGIIFGKNESSTETYNLDGNLYEDNIPPFPFADLVNQYADMYSDSSQNFDKFIIALVSIVEAIATLDKPFEDSYNDINKLYNLFEKEQYIVKASSIIENIGQLLYNIKGISNFDSILNNGYKKSVGEELFDFMFMTPSELTAEERERADKEIEYIISRTGRYVELITYVTTVFRYVNDQVSNIQYADYDNLNYSIQGFFSSIRNIHDSIGGMTEDNAATIGSIITSYSLSLNSLIMTAMLTSQLGDVNFKILTDGIIDINNSLSQLDSKSLNIFKAQTNQLEKFVNVVNKIKLLNITNLTKLVTSINQLGNKFGNLDKLTDAIANKLSKELEKLTERLLHAENTIVKADEIQKRRHELIEKSVKEVSTLMQQPMRVEITPVGGQVNESQQTLDNNSNGTENNQSNDASKKTADDTSK